MRFHNESEARQAIPAKKRIVIKVGTSSLTYANGKPNLRFFDQLARQIVDLKNREYEVVLVTSGAIAIGMPSLGFEKKPDYLPYKQACAAVGQGLLFHLYEKTFHDYGCSVGQLLLTKGDALNPKRYLYASGLLNALLELGSVPIVNENDAVAADEIKVGDNDTLSASVASICDADLLIILSDVNGLYDKNPSSHPDAKLISYVPEFTRHLFEMAGGAGTARGTGGMLTKIRAAEICAHSGIDMIIANSSEPHVIERIMDGQNLGTLFLGDNVHPQMKRRQLIIGSVVKGKIMVDEGCMKAIRYRGSSLLPVGIVSVEGDFQDGDPVSIVYNGEELARGITHYSAEDINLIRGRHSEELTDALGYEKTYDTVVHRDNLILLR
jgi:glutamate 5-kinase